MFHFGGSKVDDRPTDRLVPMSDFEAWDWVINALEEMGRENPELMAIPVAVPSQDSYIFWLTDPASARVRW